ncbi:MAG: endonuclease/exonuclease/phosphatase family protein [Bdellovibrionales bacterium]|nr:endonuclease/exonuclease/phosphatase family protein [Bdellovibrionales bacterium]
MKIKVMTLNIHKGFSLFNQRPILQELKAEIRSHAVDVLCLQEVLGEHKKHATRPQFEMIADQIWKHYAYGKNAVYSNGHHGNAILSQFPFLEFENFNISNHRFEQRGVLHGVISAPEWKGRRVHVMTAHLDLLSSGRMRQVDRILGLIRMRVKPGEPLILAGDFNDWPEELSHRFLAEAGLLETHLNRFGEHARTYPSAFPVLKLDRIYARDLAVESVQRLSGPPWDSLSDHLGLLSELRF